MLTHIPSTPAACLFMLFPGTLQVTAPSWPPLQGEPGAQTKATTTRVAAELHSHKQTALAGTKSKMEKGVGMS